MLRWSCFDQLDAVAHNWLQHAPQSPALAQICVVLHHSVAMQTQMRTHQSPERPRSEAASDDWEQVPRDIDTESERSAYMQGISRPQTPAMSLTGDMMHEGDCPTPESERLADTVLSLPFNNGGRNPEIAAENRPDHSPAAPAEEAAMTVSDAHSLDMVGLHCLQGLSQEGSLEGFALSRPDTAALPITNTEAVVEANADGVDSVADSQMAATDATDMAQQAASDTVELDTFTSFLDSLGWSGSCIAEAWKLGCAEVCAELSDMQQFVVSKLAKVGATMGVAKEQAISSSYKLLVRLAGPSPGLMITAMGLTTLATLAGLIFFWGRCRQLSTQLQQRDKELARLVMKILNLQDALQQPTRISGPVLRHTNLLSGLVASSLM